MDRELTDNLAQIAPNNEVPVYDVETEKALLSICIRDKAALDNTVSKRVVSDEFSDQRNALIYEAITKLYLDNGKIDRYNICDQLEKDGKLAQAGGTEYVFAVANTSGVKSNIDTYINIVKEKSTTRLLIDTFNSLAAVAKKGTNSVNDIVETAVGKLTALREAPASSGFEALQKILRDNINDIHKTISGGAQTKAVNTGFRGLDAMLGGLRPGTLNIVAARPGMGKTALVINIATNIASMTGRNVNIFSLEMSKSEVGNRILASRSDVTVKQLQRANLRAEDEIKLTKAFKDLAELPIYISDNSAVTPLDMMSQCKSLKAKNMLGVIIVDYLQLMSSGSSNKNDSRQNEISTISRSLKILAKDMQVPVIALSQLSRGSERREDHTPMLSDLRDSGAIEQDADSVIFIDRPDYYKKDVDPQAIQDAKLIVAKNRHGETGTSMVKWYGKKTLFFEADRAYDPVDPATSGAQAGESSYTRTQSSGASASDYNFGGGEDVPFVPDDMPVPPPEMSEDDYNNPDNDAFFADSNQGFPEGF